MNDVMLYGVRYDNLGTININGKQYTVVKNNDQLGYLEKVGDSFRNPNRGSNILGDTDFNANLLLTNVIDNIQREYIDDIKNGKITTKEDLVKRIGQIQNNINNNPNINEVLKGNHLEVEAFKNITKSLLNKYDEVNNIKQNPSYEGISTFEANNHNYLRSSDQATTLIDADIDKLKEVHNDVILNGINASTDPKENVDSAFNMMVEYGNESENTKTPIDEFKVDNSNVKDLAQANILNNSDITSKLAPNDTKPYVAFDNSDVNHSMDYVTNNNGQVYEFKHASNGAVTSIDEVEVKGDNGEVQNKPSVAVKIDDNDFAFQHFGIKEDELTLKDTNDLLVFGRDLYNKDEIEYLEKTRQTKLEEGGFVEHIEPQEEIKDNIVEFPAKVKTLGTYPERQLDKKEAGHIDTFILCLIVQLFVFGGTLVALLLIK